MEKGFIAHAGGAINGCQYTNSLEAVNQSIASGFNYIELDLRLTKDSVLVAVHEWPQYREFIGYEICDEPLYFDEFEKSKIYEKYQPLTAQMIDSIFKSNPSLKLVTDKIDDIDLLKKYFPSLNGRIFVECFSNESYKRVMDSDFAYPLMSGFNDIWDFFNFNKFYTMSNDLYLQIYKTWHYKVLTRVLNYRVSIFGVKSNVEAKSLLNDDPYVALVYVEEI